MNNLRIAASHMMQLFNDAVDDIICSECLIQPKEYVGDCGHRFCHQCLT